jgi:DNA repair protein RadC
MEAAMSQVPLSVYEARTIARALRVMEKSLVVRDVVFDSPALVRQYLSLRLFNLEAEVFMVLLLDAQNRLIEARELFRGTVSQTVVYPREVVKAALLANASAVIFAQSVARHRMRLMCPESLCAQALRVPWWNRAGRRRRGT